MNNNVSNISSIEEMKIQIQEDLIALIKEHVESSNIKFWLPEQRLDDDTICDMYKDIYNVYVVYSYKKKLKKTLN